MNQTNPDVFHKEPFSRRRLFEAGGATVGLAALLAACGNDEPPAAGRVGDAPVAPTLPKVTVDDNVYLRTMESVERSLIEVYGTLSGIEGLAEGTASAVARFLDDHTATADAVAKLTTDNGGEPFGCTNPWLMERAFQPALDDILGKAEEGDAAAIAPSDDPNRDTIAMANALETLAGATYQKMVEKLSVPALRAAVIPFGAASARRAAVAAIVAGGDEKRFVSPILLGEDLAPDEEGFTATYAIPSRFGQLTPVEFTLGATNDLGLRPKAAFETPADNAYVYADQTCES